MHRFYIRLCESHTMYYTVFPIPHVEEVNKIIVIVTKASPRIEGCRQPQSTIKYGGRHPTE